MQIGWDTFIRLNCYHNLRCSQFIAQLLKGKTLHHNCGKNNSPEALTFPQILLLLSSFAFVAEEIHHFSSSNSVHIIAAIHSPIHLTPLTQHPSIMMSKVFAFLVISMATVSLSSPAAGLPDGRNSPDGKMFFNFGRYFGRKNNDRTCTTNDECKGTKTKVCDIENNRCVKCIQDSDCRTGKALLYRSLGYDKHDRVHQPVPVERGQRTRTDGKAAPLTARRIAAPVRGQRNGQFCFFNKCHDTLPGKATCIKDSWCTSGMCNNGVCAKGKSGRYVLY